MNASSRSTRSDRLQAHLPVTWRAAPCRRTLGSLAVLVAAGLASPIVSAQSAVTVYGVVDVSVRNVHNNSGTLWTQQSGSNSSGRLGFKGSEDLGGGLQAKFAIESDVFGDTGQAGGNTVTPVPSGLFWSRMAWVGLTDAKLGEVRLGRDYTPAFAVVASYDPFGYVGIAALANFFSSTQLSTVNAAFGPNTTSTSTLARANNSIQYFTPPTLGGFYVHMMGAFRENAAAAGPTGNSKFFSGRVGYEKGPVSVAAGFANTRNTNIAGQSFKEAAIAGSYKFDWAKLFADYTQLKYVQAKSAIWMVGAQVPLGQGTARVSFGKVDQSGVAPLALGSTAAGASIEDRDATQFGLGYEYHLSKRTSMYAQGARLANKGSSAAFALPGGQPLKPGSDRTYTGYEMGVRHTF
jgi:predicted porin